MKTETDSSTKPPTVDVGSLARGSVIPIPAIMDNTMTVTVSFRLMARRKTWSRFKYACRTFWEILTGKLEWSIVSKNTPSPNDGSQPRSLE